jgi:23S rRNA-/tRNA-specific pseudouridylate synthase
MAHKTAGSVGPVVPADWPVPVNPPPTTEAHDIEALRAVQTKEAEVNAVATEILFQDDWLFAVDKPVGRYCEVQLQ